MSRSAALNRPTPAMMSASTVLTTRPVAPPLASPNPIWDPVEDTVRTTCAADVCLKALMRTHQACSALLNPAASVAATRSSAPSAPLTAPVSASRAGAARETANVAAATAHVAAHETTNRPNPSASSRGNTTACVYSKVAAAAMIPATELNAPKAPKSRGRVQAADDRGERESNRLRDGSARHYQEHVPDEGRRAESR